MIRFSEPVTSLSAWVITFLSLSRKNSVVTELTENIAGWGRIKSAMDEIRACHGDTLTFFSGVFEDLDSLCGSLLSREQELQKQAAVRREDMSASEAMDNNHWEFLHKEFEEDRAELRETQQTVRQQIGQLKGVADDLAAARSEFQTVRGEIARHSDELTAARSQTAATSEEAEAGIKEKIREMEQQKSLLEKERAVMEKELESVRSRAAEMAELNAEQRRLVAPLQSKWSEDLQQMRMMLESLTRQIEESKRAIETSPAERPASGVGAVAMTDPVLESVMAQFEVLQQDRFCRRLATAERNEK